MKLARPVVVLLLAFSLVPLTATPSDAFLDLTVDSTGDEPLLLPLVPPPDGPPLCITVVGTCTLRAAIELTNLIPTIDPLLDRDTIVFNIPDTDLNCSGGACTINPFFALPQITDPVIIDGPNADGDAIVLDGNGTLPPDALIPPGADGVLPITGFDPVADGLEIGPGAGPTIPAVFIPMIAGPAPRSPEGVSGSITPPINLGLTGGGGTVIRDLVINNFEGDGIRVNPTAGVLGSADDVTISENFIGTNAAGTADEGNGNNGVSLLNGNDHLVQLNLISGNDFNGVGILSGSAGDTVDNNNIGTNAAANADLGNSGDGVRISSSVDHTVVDNTISGNNSQGVRIEDLSEGNLMTGNTIGLAAGGLVPIQNNGNGVLIRDSSSNTIGGTTAAARNIISGNGDNGVLIDVDLETSTDNVVSGNFIGTNSAGTAAIGNSDDGVQIVNAPGNTIGGTVSGARNVISGNGTMGVRINFAPSTGNLVQGNFIGTNAAGTAGISNGSGGVFVGNGATGNTVGGTSGGAGNVISGNPFFGVAVNFGANNNTVQGNFIGTDAAGTGALGNVGAGVLINGGLNNTIGGTAAGAGNRIFNNTGDGVAVLDAASVGNAILGNSIDLNGGLGIDLANDGVTANDDDDPDAGPNNLQNFPVITSATSGSTIISGTLNSVPSTDFRLEFFSSPACDPSTFGEGASFLGAENVTTDANGDASFDNVTFADTVPPVEVVTSTATRLSGAGAPIETSEFSQCKTVTPTPVTQLDVEPETDSNVVGTQHTLTATVSLNGTFVSGANVDFEIISGPNANLNGNAATADLECDTALVTGQCTVNYTGGPNPGTDTIRAHIDANGDDAIPGEADTAEGRNEGTTPGAAEPDQTDVVEKTFLVECPFNQGCLDVEPETDTNPTGTQHTLTATVTTAGAGGPYSGGFSPTVFGQVADLNGDGTVTGRDDSNEFYGDTHIIDGGLDCNTWGPGTANGGIAAENNAGTAGDESITVADDCTLIGVDGTPDGVEIQVLDGEFQWNGPLPFVFNAADPDNPDVGDSDFAWSAIDGRVDSNGDEAIDDDDCHFGLIGETVDLGLGDSTDGADILGNDAANTNPCGFGSPPNPADNGLVDLNSDGDITAADSCANGCFFSHDVDTGVVQGGAPVAGVNVDFEIESGPNANLNANAATADLECDTDATGTCTVQYTGGPNPGTDTIRAHIDANGDDAIPGEADIAEGRNENTTPGNVAEPDQTDVVEKTFTALKIDCEPEMASHAVGIQDSTTCTVTDGANALVPNQPVDGEILAGSANDADGTTAPPDFSGTTNAQGQVVFNYTGNNPGNDTNCYWVDANNDGTVPGEGDCGEVLGDPADDDTDVVTRTWAAAGPQTCPAFPNATGNHILGTNNDDIIIGTPQRDIICLFDGDDVGRGLGGNDIIDGGRDDDELFGGDGNDLLLARSGNDVVNGNAGNDKARDSGAGDDLLRGQDGDDLLVGNAGTDLLIGGSGRDVERANRGGDILRGNSGADTLAGGPGTDRILGNADEDTLRGGDDNDDLFGGPADDRLNGGGGTDVCTGGPGIDQPQVTCEVVNP